ncbi:hypothetical protein M2119_001492 [Aurantimicrobium minutum]|uniref:hypothetical protein n=1 Tax=Aurantimicrobium minutum TaxID=708131 RepID=UPI002476174F|nr:hypothetical protein [Aurantimicrobium minutum]MDH6533255.1 hypothetical protein [Aurantimicrobium minutum]
MPKDDNTENLDNAEATQAPAEYTPTPETEAAATEADAAVTPIASARKRSLGTGAIIGISAAGVALLAGIFGAGVATANAVAHSGPPPMGQVGQVGQAGPQAHMGDMDDDGPREGGQHGPKGEHKPGGPMKGGLEADGSMPGNVPHEHDENGEDIIPEGYNTTAPTPSTTN